MLFNVNNCVELSHGELDLVILANIQASSNFETTGEKRKRSPRCSFLYLNRPVCKDMFLHLYRISYSRFRRLKEHYEEHGLSPGVHGNHKRLPHNTLLQAVTDGNRLLATQRSQNYGSNFILTSSSPNL